MLQTAAPTRRSTVVIAVTGAVALLAAGIAYVLADGPLDTSGGAGICSPDRAQGVTLYYGVLLANDGSSEIDVWSVDATGGNLASVELLIDPTGPDVGQAMGTFEWPGDSPVDDANDVMARAVDPAVATIAPHGTGQLLVALTPEDPDERAWVDRIEIRYASGWRDYAETFDGYLLERTPRRSC
ncbi:hypothetical protein [Demequina maris]|uniref:hypothetical protein n=1 Tax=Demequina maris TaxID=1638982 RepID=UPI0012E052AC|nr:hypothetical protein [Demequina maris]